MTADTTATPAIETTPAAQPTPANAAQNRNRAIPWISLGVAALAGCLIPHLISIRTGPWGNIGGTLPIFLTAVAGIVVLIALWAAIGRQPQPLAAAIAALLALTGIAATLCWAQGLPIVATPNHRAAIAATKPPLVFGNGGLSPVLKELPPTR